MFTKAKFLKSPNRKSNEKYLMIFVVAFVGMMISFIPSMIANKGIFLYYGDFNSQQMMFYQHAHDAVRAGNLGWDWGTDLGSSLQGAYSFYLFGSPFFWITILFPSGAVPYLIPWLLALKTAVASVTAYAYIRYFVNDTNACFIGGLLYAFSGFQTYNVFFNHFHDATAFFPLLLLAFEMLVRENKKGPFAIAVAICASISYFFFASEVIFVVIYLLLRCTDKDFDFTLKKFGRLAFESVVGVMISAVILMPACLAVLGNYRLRERLYGLDMVVYSENVRIPRIIQAFFMLSDMPARINIFSSEKARWASLAGYLPMFSMVGVISYIRTKSGNWKWATKALIVFTIMACIPTLNSSFILFNASYYTRWFYMPILIMCMMTAKVIGDNINDLKKGYWLCTLITAAFLVVGILPKKDESDNIVWGKIPAYIELYYVQAAVTILMICMLGILIYFVAERKVNVMKVASCMTAAAVVICMTSSVLYGVSQGDDNTDYINRAINGKDNIDMDKLEKSSANYRASNNFYRIDTSENVDNWCMFWGLSSMRCFHSTVSNSILDFYNSIGQTRDVASRMDTTLYPLRSLFSVKYYFDELSYDERVGKTENYKAQTVTGLLGFNYKDTQNGFNIYENSNYIPMGFTYDYYTTDRTIQNASATDKTKMLLKALVLTSEQAKKYKNAIKHYDFSLTNFNDADYYQNCIDRKLNSCSSFDYSSDGFDAKINLTTPKLVFFSVPYDDGWSAQINGKDVDIEKVDYGFMAVLGTTGENKITFTYRTYGRTCGMIITVSGIVIFAVYMGSGWIVRKKRETVTACAKSENSTNNYVKQNEKTDDTNKNHRNRKG